LDDGVRRYLGIRRARRASCPEDGSGLLKILHPEEAWTRAELREYLEFAIERRRRVKEQLKKLAPHDYARTAS
jgi:predicted ATP-dependent Lon-type protease